MLAKERHTRGKGLKRAGDRILWDAQLSDLPDGAVIVEEGHSLLKTEGRMLRFSWDGWLETDVSVSGRRVKVLTPPTSVQALSHGYRPVLHPTATEN
jgi:hypothetical protein